MRGGGGGHKSGGLKSGTGGPATGTFSGVSGIIFLSAQGVIVAKLGGEGVGRC